MNNQHLQDLKDRARELASACRALDILFARGAARLRQEADVEWLENLTTRLKRHLGEIKQGEESSRYASIKGDALSGISEIIVKGIGSAIGKHAYVETFEKTLLARRAGKQHCFGMTMVCVGKGGLPDDVHVVSISELARTQNRSESEIVLEIQKSGALLFTPDEFWQLIEGLVRDIREGKSRLPILLSS